MLRISTIVWLISFGIILLSLLIGSVCATVTQANVMDLSNTATNAGLNPFFIFFVIQSFMKVLGTGLLTCATILPLMLQFGVPVAIALMFQSPIWIVEAFGIYQLITGYNMGGME